MESLKTYQLSQNLAEEIINRCSGSRTGQYCFYFGKRWVPQLGGLRPAQETVPRHAFSPDSVNSIVNY